MSAIVRACLLSGLLTVWAGPGFLVGTLQAQISPEIQAKGAELEAKLAEIRKLNIAKKYDDAGKVLTQAEAIVAELKASDNAQVKRAATTAERNLAGIKKTLEGRGVKFAAAAPAPAKPATPAGTPAPTATAGTGDGSSFMKDIVPILSSKCGNCHMGNMMRGQFSANTFENLMKGAAGASIITVGKGKESRLVEVIESGDMPRGGGKVSPTELAALVKWIDLGAKFDGPDRNAPLRAAGGNTPREQIKLATATGNEKVRFSRDIAPVLVASCVGCHGGQNPAGDLGLNNFPNILKGGDSGLIIQVGKAADSLLIKKLKGTAPEGQRMPRGKSPLPDATIALFETWINEGAKFDGTDPTLSTELVANIYKAQTMTHEELGQERVKLANANWKLGNPEEEAETVETDHFTIMGNVPKAKLEEISKLAEEQHTKVSDLFKLGDSEPLLKGRLTVFVFNKQYEYTEYGTMVEQRSIPRDWRGHWRYTIIDAYACLAPPREDDDTIQRILAEQLVGAHIESLGKVPNWFSQGAARAVSAKFEAKNPAVATWDGRVPGILAGVTDPTKLLDGSLNMSDASVIYYAFVKGLLTKTASYQQLLKSLKDGKDFDASFMAAYKADPATLAAAWARAAASGKRPR